MAACRFGGMDVREQFEELLAYAREDSDVLGLYVFGSRAREDELRDEHSDYDVGVVLRDGEGVMEAFDARWPYAHGAGVEIARSTLSELRGLGEYGGPTEWSRYLYSRVDLVIDKTGEIEPILSEKQSVPEEVRDRLVREGLDAFVNSTYRSLRYRMVGSPDGARLDAAESIPPLLTALFAIDFRVRPFNKYLEVDLRESPLADPAWAADRLLSRLLAVIDGGVQEQHALFRDVERVAHAQGFGDVIDGWEPDVAWLRGDAEYRPAQA
jgi:predicted nucleotidyltransferase